MFEVDRRDGVARMGNDGARWLSTSWDGGYRCADAVYNLTVPEGFERTDLDAYREQRLADAGFATGPALLTGVEMANARCARSGPVTVLATAGVSNPAVLPMGGDETAAGAADDPAPDALDADWRPGTVNLLVGACRTLDDGALATLLATAVEAKVVTLLDVAGVPGTTSDAALVGCVPDAPTAEFAGSATDVGAATRACVRDAVRGSLAARYDDGPPAPAEAPYGVVTDRQTDVFEP